ncbi:helix-turn-helix transcriptional regulator [bacterium]|nr:helix-turn-helix transcriptional regulator [bacterium]
MTRKITQLSNKICLKIKLERQKRNISQEKLAEMADLSRPTIGKIERAEVSPSIDTIEKLAMAFGVDFLDLVDVSKFEL